MYGKEKKVLKKTLKEKEENMVNLRFDLLYRTILYDKMAKDRKEIASKMEEVRKKFDTERALGRKLKSNERIVKLEDEGTKLAQQLQKIDAARDEVFKLWDVAEKGESYIRILKSCVKDPSKIYGERPRQPIKGKN